MADTLDTFAYRAPPVPLRRRVTSRAWKAAVAGFVLVALLGLFARWVIASERASFRALAAHEAPPALVTTIEGQGDTPQALADAALTPQDLQAQRIARHVLAVARHVAAGGSLAAVGPAALARRLPSYTFVEGPSPMPEIVSVATGATGWGAAVEAASGRCWLIRAVPDGGVRFASTTEGCSAASALSATGTSW